MLPAEWWTFLSGPSVILLEEEVGMMKEYFIWEIISMAAAEGRRIRLLTPSPVEEVKSEAAHTRKKLDESLLSVVGHLREHHLLAEECGSELNVIDPFVFYCQDGSASFIHELMESLRKKAREGHTILLSFDLGVLPESHVRIAEIMADGVIRFLARMEEEKVRHYLYVPKLRGAPIFSKLMPVDVTEEGMQLDTRERYG